MIALSALKTNWKLVAGIGAAIVLVVLLALLRAEKRTSVRLGRELAASVEARKQDRVAYVNAQVAAAALNRAKVATIEAKSQEITNDISQDYAGDLRRLRDDLGRVRRQTAAPDQRAAGSPRPSQVPNPAQGSDEATGVCISTGQLLHGAETELQLEALITWVEAQGKVER